MDSTSSAAPPLISVVIPVYNRKVQLVRSIGSCLSSKRSDIEVVVSDDGSTDGSAEVARTLGDRRVAVVCSAANRGVGTARNVGVGVARAPWVVFLDSDDEMIPGGLDAVARELTATQQEYARVGFCYEFGGVRSPDPFPSEGVLDYRRYLSWLDGAVRSDMLVCVRRETFAAIRFPDDRGYELLYHLRFHQRFTSKVVPITAAKVHFDAPNRASNLSFSDAATKSIREAPDVLRQFQAIIAEHGDALSTLAPRYFRRLLRRTVVQASLAGDPHAARKTHSRFREQFGWSTTLALCTMLGGVSPGMIAVTGALLRRRPRRN